MPEVRPYGGWENCLHLAAGGVELVATLDVGPRIIRLSPQGGANLFKEFPAEAGLTGGEEWRPYGGHRFWHAPEAQPRTYLPDNAPVEWHEEDGGIVLLQPPEEATRLRKRLDLYIHPDRPHVRVRHRLVNLGLWEVTAAPWALSVMAEGGRAIVPQEPYAPHPDALLPARPLVLWPYTNMADPRFTWGRRYIQLCQQPGAGPAKFGARNTAGWAAYALGNTVFIKRARFRPEAVYPDFGCNTEIFTNGEMLEVESLGPLEPLVPAGGEAVHEEHWFLFRAGLPETEEGLERALQPLLDQSLAWMQGA